MLYNILSIMTLILSFILGVYVYQSDKSNPVNRTFLLLILSVMFWIFCNFIIDISASIKLITFWSEIAIIGPILIAYFFYRLSVVFPRKKISPPSHEKALLSLVLVLIALSFTELNLASVYLLENGIPAIKPGHLYPFFLVYFVSLLAFSLKNLFSDYKIFNKFEKLQVQYISLGLAMSALMGIIVDGILPLLGNSEYVNLGPYFILFFIFFTFYAVIKFKMFDIKIITTQLLVFSLWVFVFLRMLVSDTHEDRLINGGLLALLLIVGTFLIRSVIKEVNQREKIEKLAGELQVANDRLRELDTQKSEFVSFATHQLRAPLTAMKGYASLILEGDLGKLSHVMRDAVTRIYDSSKTLTSIVDDYLNISRIELGSMKYSFEQVDLKKLVEDVIAELKPNIEKSKLSFLFSADKEKKFMVQADRDKFKQIILNLIDNSVKYTPSGSVEVTVYKNNAKKIIFFVKDTGIGIAPEVLPKLFAKFSRANNANKQNIHGTGLGLFVAKEIVLAHNGKIWAESAGEGRGSAFFVELEEAL